MAGSDFFGGSGSGGTRGTDYFSGAGGSGSWWDNHGTDVVDLGIAGGLAIGSAFSKPSGQAQSDRLNESGLDLLKMGKASASQGQDALAPVLKYLKALTSGDPAALDQALAPERARVLDQFDAARKAIGQFSPRGGGVTSALNATRTSQAETLATLPGEARRSAVNELGQLGVAMTNSGLSAQAAGNAALADVFTQKQQQDKQTSDTWKAIARIALIGAGAAFGGPGGAAVGTAAGNAFLS